MGEQTMKRSRCFLWLVAIMPAVRLWGADELTLANRVTLQGTFKGFDNRAFVFRMDAGRSDRREYIGNVAALRLNPAAKVSIHPTTGPAESGWLLLGYSNGWFLLTRGSEETRRAAMQVKRVQMEFDAQRTEGRGAGSFVISRGEPVQIEQHVQRGAVTVVHFHLPTSLSSVRQGGYVERLAANSRGAVAFRRVEVSGWDQPVCRELNIRSLPQFWFYDPAGRLAVQLTDRFTEADIEAAITKARRGGA